MIGSDTEIDTDRGRDVVSVTGSNNRVQGGRGNDLLQEAPNPDDPVALTGNQLFGGRGRR